jgi:3',5'-cyclic AMP phosphodiesterase CpdA
MATFVLAHLSDPHLGPLPKPRLHELAGKRATGFLNWRHKRHLVHRSDVLARIVADLKAQVPDHIAVTGDLLIISLPDEYAPAHAWLKTLGPPQDVSLVPGNHDVYVRSAAQQPQHHWGEYMRSGTAGELGFPFLRRRGPLALIGLSSAVPTAPFMATGRLGADQLQRLSTLLDQSGRERLFRVVLIHHPPLSKPGERMKHLTDAAEFREVLADYGAELVIHGHDHAHSVMWLDGPRGRIAAVGVPSASEAPPGEHDSAGYNLYTIGGQPGAWQCEMHARGLAADGNSVVERARIMLAGG